MTTTKAGRAMPTGLRDDLARDLRRIIDGLPVDKPFAYDPAAIADALIEGGWIVPLGGAEAREQERERIAAAVRAFCISKGINPAQFLAAITERSTHDD